MNVPTLSRFLSPILNVVTFSQKFSSRHWNINVTHHCHFTLVYFLGDNTREQIENRLYIALTFPKLLWAFLTDMTTSFFGKLLSTLLVVGVGVVTDDWRSVEFVERRLLLWFGRDADTICVGVSTSGCSCSTCPFSYIFMPSL